MATAIASIMTFLILGCVLLVATRFGRPYLFCCTVGFILISNITVTQQVELFGFTTSLGVVVYSLVYLATDICSEYGEPRDAYRLAIANLVAQVTFMFYIWLSVITPPAPADFAHPLIVQLFSTTPRITIAAIIAAAGAFVDISIYEVLMQRHGRVSKLGALSASERVKLALRNNLSTMLGQLVNTTLFFTVAFYGVPGIHENLVAIVLSAWLVKVVFALIDTPILLAARRVLPDDWRDL